MKTRVPLLRNFINDFQIENKDESVCFTANIEFRTNSVFKKLDCEVHLVTFEGTDLSMLYLLHPDIIKHDIPDAIPYNAENFFYRKNRFLLIEGNTKEQGPYALMIYPIDRKCYTETKSELRQKYLN